MNIFKSIKMIPIIKNVLVNLGLLYSKDSFNNSVSDICNIIPAIKENNKPNKVSVINGSKNK